MDVNIYFKDSITTRITILVYEKSTYKKAKWKNISVHFVIEKYSLESNLKTPESRPSFACLQVI